MLMPIDEALQMRPHMAHLDTTAAKPSQEVVKQEDPAEELVALQVSPPSLNLGISPTICSSSSMEYRLPD